MKTTMIIFLLLSLMSLTACNEGGGSGEQSAAPKTATPAPTLTPVPSEPTDETVMVTYYSLSRTEAPVAGWTQKTYTATGYCTEIQEKTFCWSDGLKILQWVDNNVQYGPLKYNFWGLSTSNNKPQTCDGGCADDYMQSPKLITAQLLQLIPAEDIQYMFDHGTQNQMSCTVSQTTATCGSLTFELQ